MDTILEMINMIWELLQSLRQTIRIADVVDILIIAFLIYRILSFMRKTSASSVIKGIIIILLVAGISNFYGLIVLDYLMRQVLQMGILVVIVLFQPELRKMFEQMGTSRLNFIFRKRGRYENIESAISSVVAASEAMAKSRTGALIIFEREVGLNDFAVTGTSVDANTSPELIQNIFYHNSPLHDGALLIRDGRLLAAACMLPLSSNVNLGRDLGMRHRAGVGISERSDAVAVIVSEQTGTISVAVDGMLKRHLSKDTFEKLLLAELMYGGNKQKVKKQQKKTDKQKGST
jgi:diadenylate cyclase